MAHADGTVLAEELYPVAAACGLSTEQVRSCLRRLIGEGLLTREGRGQQATFRSTDAGLRSMRITMERTKLAYAQDAAGKGWDRQWRLVAFAIPEGQRAGRDGLREFLLELGGAAVQNGLYVSPHDWHRSVAVRAERLGVREYLAMSTTDDLDVGGETDPRKLARRLWNIDELGARYEAFVERYQHVPEELSSLRQRRERLPEATFLPGTFAMAATLNECFLTDPLLPPELLPRPWPGRAARDLAARSRRLAVAILESHTRPTLFHLLYEAIDSMR
jgi:phenylacetic acid degradation operon negative regulatory protein